MLTEEKFEYFGIVVMIIIGLLLFNLAMMKNLNLQTSAMVAYAPLFLICYNVFTRRETRKKRAKIFSNLPQPPAD
jgi:hypothetical protein